MNRRTISKIVFVRWISYSLQMRTSLTRVYMLRKEYNTRTFTLAVLHVLITQRCFLTKEYIKLLSSYKIHRQNILFPIHVSGRKYRERHNHIPYKFPASVCISKSAWLLYVAEDWQKTNTATWATAWVWKMRQNSLRNLLVMKYSGPRISNIYDYKVTAYPFLMVCFKPNTKPHWTPDIDFLKINFAFKTWCTMCIQSTPSPMQTWRWANVMARWWDWASSLTTTYGIVWPLFLTNQRERVRNVYSDLFLSLSLHAESRDNTQARMPRGRGGGCKGCN